MGKLLRIHDRRRSAARISQPTFFSRTELNQLLSLYSRRVMSGEWRDYAIDQQAGTATFSIYRHSHDRPLFTIAKRARGGERGAEYVVCRDREKLVKASCLSDALGVFRPPLSVIS